MKVSFIMPPPLDNKRAADRCYGCNYGIYFLPHLPSLYMATIIRDKGFDVDVQDFAAQKYNKKRFIEYINNNHSDFYVFFTVFLSEKTDIEARRLIRNINDKAKYIFCGTQATWRPESFIDSEDSFVIRGETEILVYELIRDLITRNSADNVDGVSYLKNGTVIHNKSVDPIKMLDDLPIPDRRLVDHRPYYNPKLTHTPHTSIITSRGCFGKCSYCVPNAISFARELEYKKTYCKKPIPKLHSENRVIQEFEEIAELGFKSVTVIDDEFLWNELRTIKICEGIRHLNLEWTCLARADMVTEKSVFAMEEAGCKFIDLGVESFCQEILDDIGKGMNVKTIKEAIKIIGKTSIEPKINVLLGATPLETEESIKYTIDSVEKLDVKYVLYDIAAPFPGTDFYYTAKEKNWIVTGDYVPIDPSKESIISYPHLSKERLESLLNQGYRKHYFNSRYILKQVVCTKSLADLKNKAYTAINMFKRNVLRKS